MGNFLLGETFANGYLRKICEDKLLQMIYLGKFCEDKLHKYVILQNLLIKNFCDRHFLDRGSTIYSALSQL